MCLWLSALVWMTRPAVAQESPDAEIKRLNKQALDAYDNLNFDQSKGFLEQALAQADAAGLAKDALAARTRLNLGLLLIAGFQKHDEAIEQFKMALHIQPAITPTPGLFNPEVQAAFEEAKASVRTESRPNDPAQGSRPPVAKRPPPSPLPDLGQAVQKSSGGEAEAAEDEQDAEEAKISGHGYLLSLGLGSGFGTAKGHLDANTTVSHTDAMGPSDNSWSGVAASRLIHLSLGVGYYLSENLLVGLDGRVQFITGTTSAPSGGASPPTSAVAVFARANWYFSRAPVRPFVSGGLGLGAIRQVVTLNGLDGKKLADCGSGAEQCVDTVTGGPLFLAAGGGVAYELGSFVFLASLTANGGIPKWMLNLDAQVGVGLHL
jgi:tetratricopeptide (TPR) repeat protein